MRKFVMAVLLLVSAVTPSLAQGVTSDPAVLAYRSGDFDTARVLLLEDLAAEPAPEGRERGRLFYALGNVAARQERWPEAVGWYEASRRLRPRDADTWANLELARSRAGFEPADRGDLADTVERLLGLVTPAESRWLALVGVALAAAAFAFEALRGGAAGRRTAFAGALVLLVCVTPWARHVLARGEDPLLVIAGGPLPARSEPRTDAARLFEVSPDQRVERVGTFLEWTQVEDAGGAVGWVPSRAVFPLDGPAISPLNGSAGHAR